MSAEQLDMLDALDLDPVQQAHEQRIAARRQTMHRHLAFEGGRPDDYSDRRRFGCLRPGEACPGCGHVFTAGGYDASGDHGVPHDRPEPVMCDGMISYRRHAAHYARELLALDAINADDDSIFRALTNLKRAAAAAAPCYPADVRQAWIDYPEQLIAEVDA